MRDRHWRRLSSSALARLGRSQAAGGLVVFWFFFLNREKRLALNRERNLDRHSLACHWRIGDLGTKWRVFVVNCSTDSPANKGCADDT